MVRCNNCGWDNTGGVRNCEKCNTPLTYDVFISYSRKDYVDDAGNVLSNNILLNIKDNLKASGISYWFDEEGIYSGDEFASVITNAIRKSRIFLFISSVNSNQSRWTSNEISTALEFEKPIIPFRIDNSPYNDSVMMKIVSFDYIQCNDVEKAMSKLLRAIKHHLPSSISHQRKSVIDVPVGANGATVIFDVEGKRTENIYSYIDGEAKILHKKVTAAGHNITKTNGFMLQGNGKVLWVIITTILIVAIGGGIIFFSGNYKRVSVIKENSKYGLGVDGKSIIECEYDSIENSKKYHIENEYFILYKNSKLGIADTLGKIILPCEYENVSKSHPYYIVSKDGKQGVMDSIGNNIIPIKYKSLSFTSYYELDIISLKYNSAIGFIAQELNGMWGILSTSNEYMVKPKYYEIKELFPGYKVLNKDGTYNYLLSSPSRGFQLIDKKYKDIIGSGLLGTLLVLGTNNKYGYINILGLEIIPCNYSIAKEFSLPERAFVKQNSDDDWTCIDTKGNIIFTISCDSVGNYWDGKARIFKDGKQYEIDKFGKMTK